MSSVASPVETSDQAVLLSHLHAGTVGDTRGDVAVCDTRMLDTCFKEYFHANTLELIASGAFALSRVVRALNRESFRMDEASLSRHLFMVLYPPACTQITLQKMQGSKRNILTYVAPDGGFDGDETPSFHPSFDGDETPSFVFFVGGEAWTGCTQSRQDSFGASSRHHSSSGSPFGDGRRLDGRPGGVAFDAHTAPH